MNKTKMTAVLFIILICIILFYYLIVPDFSISKINFSNNSINKTLFYIYNVGMRDFTPSDISFESSFTCKFEVMESLNVLGFPSNCEITQIIANRLNVKCVNVGRGLIIPLSCYGGNWSDPVVLAYDSDKVFIDYSFRCDFYNKSCDLIYKNKKYNIEKIPLISILSDYLN